MPFFEKYRQKVWNVQLFVLSLQLFSDRSPPWVGLSEGNLYIRKSVTCALFKTLRNLAVPKISQKQSNNDAHGYVISILQELARADSIICLHIGVGFGVARSD